MVFDQSTQEYEQSRLIHVTNQIKIQIEEGSDVADILKRNIIDIQKSMSDHINPTPSDMDDFANIWQYQTDLVRESNKAIFFSNRVGRLVKMLKNPYFARIDFKEDGYDVAYQIYIGISNLKDKTTSEFLIFDWRAPVSGMFYDFELGKVGYTCPDGRINGEILLKRQFRLWNSEIQFMFDSSIAINDDILQEILGKSSDSRMKTIVTSIQREQNSVIRNDAHKLLMVYGPAGSGKTSIALHRAAYLLYRYRESITSENIVIFSPNNIFSDYISDVLPELGEENIKRSTFFEYAQKTLDSGIKLEDGASQMEYLLRGSDDEGDGSQFQNRILGIKYKSSEVIIKELQAYALSIENNRIFEDASFNGELIESGEEILKYFSEELIFLPVAKRLEKIRNRLTAKLDILISRRIEEVVIELAQKGEYPNAAEIQGRSIFIVRREAELVRNKIAKMTDLNLSKCYRGFLAYGITDENATKTKKAGNTKEIYTCNKKDFDNEKIFYEDIAPLLLLNGLLYGFTNMHEIKHVIIDEVQDYTPIQFELFKLIFGNCNMTLLGDPNQAINPFTNPCSFNTVSNILKSEAHISVQLRKSYRSTRQITEFCKNLIKCENETDYINREGEQPKVIRVPNKKSLYTQIAEDINKLKTDGAKSIAVIARTENDCRVAYDNLSELIELSFITADKQDFFTGTAVITSYLTKGLEFDAVILMCMDPTMYERSGEVKLVYTLCSRALHKLHIYCLGGFPGFLKHLDTKTYEISEYSSKNEN